MDDGCSPGGGVDVAEMAREKPEVALEIFGRVLQLSIDRFMQFFDKGGPGSASVRVMCFNIFHEDCEALCAVAEFGWILLRGFCGVHHQPGLAEV